MREIKDVYDFKHKRRQNFSFRFLVSKATENKVVEVWAPSLLHAKAGLVGLIGKLYTVNEFDTT